MKRRDFIKTTSLASASLLIPDFLKALGNTKPALNEKKLVVIQLSGGNDWLNTFIPYTNDTYYKLRKKIAIDKNNLTPLDNTLAINNSLISLKPFFDSGEMSVVNAVGYPNPDRSHFRSMDIWHTASKSNEIITTGWLGQFLDANCTSSREAIEVDDYLSLALKGEKYKGLAFKNLDQLYKEVNTPFFNDIVSANSMLNEGNQGYLYKTLIDAESNIKYIYEKNKVIQNNANYPNNNFAKQLKNIASLIQSNIDTKIYYISIAGFDTHVQQLNNHNKLLQNYAESVSAFINDLKQNNLFNNTLIFTFSEFGRRVEENASQGTDHGTAGNVILFSGALKQKGLLNTLPSLTDLDNGDLKFSIDFRSIYKNILQNWLQTTKEIIGDRSIKTFEIV
ncbi:MAG: DUF1501 domain-containing protein [Bacteroidetes bacterium]|nr:DUF1501 domain-containing protein [Bacteroidota bacterium]